MKLIFKKGFDGDMEKLPAREVEGAVAFKEPETIQKFAVIANTLAAIILIVAVVPVIILSRAIELVFSGSDFVLFNLMIAAVLSLVVMPVHEVLHASCFKGEVEFYTYLKKGLMFVVGTESMSKARFVFMSMLPNLVFGFIPYILFFFFPSQLWLGLFGAFCLGSGAGDYINVFNAITQMPKGAKCFMSKNRSYWYKEK